MKRAVILLAELLSMLSMLDIAPSAQASSAAPALACQFIAGFKSLHDQISATVGDCIEDQQPSAEGATQHTTKGLLSWTADANITEFTDGSQTWVSGPFGLQQRGNEQRYEWELDSRSGNDFRENASLMHDGTFPVGSGNRQSFDKAIASESSLATFGRYSPGEQDGIVTSSTGLVTGPGFSLQLQPYWLYFQQNSMGEVPTVPGFQFESGPRPPKPPSGFPVGLIVAGHQPAPSEPSCWLCGGFHSLFGSAWSDQVTFTTDAGAKSIAVPSTCAVWYFIPGSTSWVWAEYVMPSCPADGMFKHLTPRPAPPDPLLIIKSIQAT